MSLYWLAYRQDGASCVLIIEAPELIMARLKAEKSIPGINARFAEGYPLDGKRAGLVPPDMIGRPLDADKACRLLDRLDALATTKISAGPSRPRNAG